MTKRLKSKFHTCKKLNKSYSNIWGLPKGDFLRSVRNEKKKKTSVYGKLLGAKQSLKCFYCNMQEQAFKRIFKKSIKSSLTTLDRFISFLESRLDVILFRSCLISSLHQARQMINHGVVLVNGKRVRNAGTKLCKLDIIELKKELIIKNIQTNETLEVVKSNFNSRFFPSHLEIDYKSSIVIFLWEPNYENVYYSVKADYEIIKRFYR